ncbi:MAG: GFA family protein [bacterium]|nr:GFA family protein [bacterium]
MSWRDEPPYANPDSAFLVKYRAQCFCGAVRFEVRADPVDAKICHCRQCQLLHGAPFQWAVIFHKRDVRFVRGPAGIYFYSAESLQVGHGLPCKLSCTTCRTPIADEGRRMFLAFGPLFDFGFPSRIPPPFEPTCHIFYGARVIDVPDTTPKYLGHKGKSPLWHGELSKG